MRITRIYLDVDLRLSFEGLAKLHKAMGTVLFINKARTSFKILVDQKYLVYYRSTRRIPVEAIRHLPHTFGGTEMEMNQAITKSLQEKMKWK